LKLNRQDAAFQPITITLETRAEAETLRAVISKATGSHGNDLLYKLFVALGNADVQNKSDKLYKGTLTWIRPEVDDEEDEDLY
jgi:hypothetical protein